MTRSTNARLAGFTFLFYIALGIPAMVLFGGSLTQITWVPMAAFEIPLALWLLIKGVAVAARPTEQGGIPL